MPIQSAKKFKGVMMIEIAIHDIANYDMVQFEQALRWEGGINAQW